MAPRAAFALLALCALFRAYGSISCPNRAVKSTPIEKFELANGTLTFLNLNTITRMRITDFDYSLGRCLQANVIYNEREMNVSIECLNGRIIQTFAAKIYAAKAYITHNFTHESDDKQMFELYVCDKDSLEQGWVAINREPGTVVDANLIRWSQLTFANDCTCNFRVHLNVQYSVGLPGQKKKELKLRKGSESWIAAGVGFGGILILLMCVACSYF